MHCATCCPACGSVRLVATGLAVAIACLGFGPPALGTTYTFDPSGAQPLSGQRGDPQCTKLLDGLVDTTANWDNSRWVGFQVSSWPGGPIINFDLGASLYTNTLNLTYLVDHDGSVHAPDMARVTLSNNADFSSPLSFTWFTGFNDAPDPDRRQRVGEVRTAAIDLSSASARYARLEVQTTGGPSDPWIFLGEATFGPLVRQKVLSGVPDYRWNYGCTPTSAAMLMGYWDRKGFGRLVKDEAVVAPLNSDPQSEDRPRDGHRDLNTYETGVPVSNAVLDAVIGSEGHHRDYWQHGLGLGEGRNQPDPMTLGHADDCLADFLGTSRYPLANGFAWLSSVSEGLRDWAARSGYAKSQNYTLMVGNNDSAPIFEKLMAEINQDAVVLLHLALDGLDDAGHTVLAYGYKDGGAGDQWFAVRDTWQNGDTNGFRIISRIDPDGTEWWFWNTVRDPANPVARVLQMNPFWLEQGFNKNARVTAISDSFSRGPDETADLGYHVIDGSADESGRISACVSPIDPSNSVLKVASVTGDPVGIGTIVDVSAIICLDFEYLFEDAGKIEVKLGSFVLDVFDSPLVGPGAPQSGVFGQYNKDFDLEKLGIDLMQTYEFSLALSGTNDPTLYLDDLHLVGVPEPGTLLLLALGGLVVLGRKRR